jgi:nucleotide-binding universal stress UspA family protein
MPDPMSALPAPARAPGATPQRAIRRILLATDLTGTSAGATDQAFELARQLGADLLAVSVIDPGIVGNRPGEPILRMDQRRAERELAAQVLVLRGRREGVGVSFLVWEGEPGPSIVDAAVSEQVDLIVVGTHGRNRVERMVLGSVSDHVTRNAPCPVLVVRT